MNLCKKLLSQNWVSKVSLQAYFQCKTGWKNCIVIWQYDGNSVSFFDGIVDSTQ